MRKTHAAILLLETLLIAGLVYTVLPVNDVWDGPHSLAPGVDWGAYRDAALAFATGGNPYNYGFYNAAWLLPVLLPLAILPRGVGFSLLFAINLTCYMAVFYRLRLRAWQIVIIAVFSNMALALWNGNPEGIIALGFVIPFPYGLILLLCKPQFAIGYIVFMAWKERAKIDRRYISVAILCILQLALYGIPAVGNLPGAWWNYALTPDIGTPIFVALMVAAFRFDNVGLAIMASPFLSPYVAVHTWSVVWIGGMVAIEIWRKRKVDTASPRL